MELPKINHSNGPINYILDNNWKIIKCSTSFCCEHVLNSLMCIHKNCIHANFIKLWQFMLQQCKTRKWISNIYTHKKIINNTTLYIVITRNELNYYVTSFTTKNNVDTFIDLGDIHFVTDYFMDQ
jgi:hypothetical protein